MGSNSYKWVHLQHNFCKISKFTASLLGVVILGHAIVLWKARISNQRASPMMPVLGEYRTGEAKRDKLREM